MNEAIVRSAALLSHRQCSVPMIDTALSQSIDVSAAFISINLSFNHCVLSLFFCLADFPLSSHSNRV